MSVDWVRRPSVADRWSSSVNLITGRKPGMGTRANPSMAGRNYLSVARPLGIQKVFQHRDGAPDSLDRWDDFRLQGRIAPDGLPRINLEKVDLEPGTKSVSCTFRICLGLVQGHKKLWLPGPGSDVLELR